MNGARLLRQIDDYIESLFAVPDAALRANRARADAAGLPRINVSPTEGKLLSLVAQLVRARRVLEIGTLGGYSTTWLARALPPGGVVITLEVNAVHANVARANLNGVAPGVDIDIRVGDACQLLDAMIAAHEEPFDVIFIDADKPRYVRYLERAIGVSRAGTVILADNVIRNGAVLAPAPDDANGIAARAYNQAIAEHPRLESIVLPIIREKVDGLAISLVKGE